jgi:hypothetical protein
MDRPRFARTVIALFSLSVAVGSFQGCSNDGGGGNDPSTADYTALLGKFPIGSEGKGLDPYFSDEATDQATTYAQILSSESLRYRDVPTLEGEQRIREAAFWLLDNADLDQDGKPGWGLPFAWDAFGDGSVNPPDQPYTIDTAIVAIGLLDTLDVEGFWSPEEKQVIIDTLREAFSRWCREVWVQDASGDSYFMYSTNIADHYFVVNVSSMFVGALQRFLSGYGYVLDRDEMTLYTQCADSVAGSIVDKVSMVSGAPFWPYLESPLLPSAPNDLVHHAYIVFGMEMYRYYGGHQPLPWTIEQSVKSLDLFLTARSCTTTRRIRSLQVPSST